MTESPRQPSGEQRPRLSDVIRAAAQGGPSADCPGIEAIHGAVAGAGHSSESERQRVFAHAERCGVCAAEVALAKAFERPTTAGEAREVDSILESIRRPLPMARSLPTPRRRWVAWTLSAAAVALLGVTIGPRLFDGDPGRPSIGIPSNLQRGEAVQLVSPLGPTRFGALTFEWKAVSGARSYEVAVRAADGSAVLRRDVPENKLETTPEAGDVPFRPGSIYFWKVRALGGDGADLGGSGEGTFTLSPDGSEPR